MIQGQPFIGRTVLVTGAGGFIGSALVAALANYPIHSLILIDASEQNLFEVRARLISHHPSLPLQAVLGRVEDAALIEEIFRGFQPEFVFHAAAHKHVELLEFNPFEAARTNILGTYRLVLEAARHRCRAFTLISTDKAVNPHSIMGATKRVAELVTISQNYPGMNAVRLGNVTGSTGSVVSIFKSQIEQNKPLTITHVDATRYFISADDAVNAILDASTSSAQGKILLPDLGSPVRIVDLARTMIAGRNLATSIVGLRPGEKLSEHLVGPRETCASMIPGSLRVIDSPAITIQQLDDLVLRISEAIACRNLKSLLHLLLAIVPEYQPSPILSPYL